MSFPEDFHEFTMWRNQFDPTPETWVRWKRMQEVYEDYQANLLRYEIGLDLVDLMTNLVNQGAPDDLLGEAVRRAYDWKALSVDAEPE